LLDDHRFSTFRSIVTVGVDSGIRLPHSIQPETVPDRMASSNDRWDAPLLTICWSIPMLRVFPTPRQCWDRGALICLASDARWLKPAVALRDLLLACSVPTTYSIGKLLDRRSLAAFATIELTCCAC